MFQKVNRIISKYSNKYELSILSNWKMKVDKVIDVEPQCLDQYQKLKHSTIFKPKKYYNLKDQKSRTCY